MTNSRLGQLLRERRGDRSQREIVERVPGLARTTYAAIENGDTRTIGPELANDLVRALGNVTVMELLEAMGWPVAPMQSERVQPALLALIAQLDNHAQDILLTTAAALLPYHRRED